MRSFGFEHPSAEPVALLLADIDCDARSYWQRSWIGSRIDCRSVDLGTDNRCDRNSAVANLDRALRGIDAPLILVGHGVGALTIVAWGELMGQEIEPAIAGALLIAPTDPLAAGDDRRLTSFSPVPATILPFPALVIASEDDPLLSLDRAFSFARQWGAGFARFGESGHFRPCDGFGHWAQGEELLDRFIGLVEPDRARSLAVMEAAFPAMASRQGASAPLPRG